MNAAGCPAPTPKIAARMTVSPTTAIIVNVVGRQLQALLDIGTSHNFIKDMLVSALMRLTTYRNTALGSLFAHMKQDGTGKIPVKIGSHHHDVRFLVSKELRPPIVRTNFAFRIWS